MGFPSVSENLPNADEHRRQLARKINQINAGKFNCTATLTLTASATSTTLTDTRIQYSSVILFMPQTAHAAAELASGNLYVAQSGIVATTGKTPGHATISHTNNSQTDRTFVVGIFG